jgi:DNA-binding NarL/FixJ family response regulator
MVAIAIFSADPVLRGTLEQLPREDPAITVVGIVDSPSALLELAETHHVDVVLAETLPSELFDRRSHRRASRAAAWILSVAGRLLLSISVRPIRRRRPALLQLNGGRLRRRAEAPVTAAAKECPLDCDGELFGPM